MLIQWLATAQGSSASLSKRKRVQRFVNPSRLPATYRPQTSSVRIADELDGLSRCSLQSGILRLCLSKDRNAGVGRLPERKQILVRRSGLGLFSR